MSEPTSSGDHRPLIRGGVPVYANLEMPKLLDGAEESSVDRWTGANRPSLLLLRCVEPIRDLTHQFRVMAESSVLARSKRAVKSLATPLHTLSELILKLLNMLSLDRGLTPRPSTQQRKLIREWIEWLKECGIDKQCDLSTVRNKIGAHVDAEAVSKPEQYWGKVDLRTFVHWTDALIIVLARALDLDVYAWSKLDTRDNIWRLMSVDGTLVDLLIENREPTMIVAVTFTESPKKSVFQELMQLQTLCRHFRTA